MAGCKNKDNIMKKIKLLFMFIFLILLGNLVYSGENDLGNRRTYDEYGFSFRPPVSFRERRTAAGVILYDWDYNSFVPVINFEKAVYKKPVDDYVKELFSQWENIYDNLSLIENSKFSTNNGIIGDRFIISFELLSRKMKQMFFIFNNNDIMTIIYITIDHAAKDEYIKILDESIKTFQWQGIIYISY